MAQSSRTARPVSSKTYTLTGGASAYAERGIIPRDALRGLPRGCRQLKRGGHTVRVSYLEIYNEHGFWAL